MFSFNIKVMKLLLEESKAEDKVLHRLNLVGEILQDNCKLLHQKFGLIDESLICEGYRERWDAVLDAYKELERRHITA